MENFKPNFHTLNFPAFSPEKIGELLVKNPHFNPRTCYGYRITNAWIGATFLLNKYDRQPSYVKWQLVTTIFTTSLQKTLLRKIRHKNQIFSHF